MSGRVTRRMNPALIHVANVRVTRVSVCNSNKNLKTSLRKKKIPLRREQRWAERGRRLRNKGEEGWLASGIWEHGEMKNPNDYGDDDGGEGIEQP